MKGQHNRLLGHSHLHQLAGHSSLCAILLNPDLVLADIREDKIWIQEDRTEAGVASELAEMGVPKDAIVLAFHAPYKRPYTGFAVA